MCRRGCSESCRLTQQHMQHYRIKQCTLWFVWQHSLEHVDGINMKITELRQPSESLRSASCRLHILLFHDKTASLGTKCSSANLCANSFALGRRGNSHRNISSVSVNIHLSSGDTTLSRGNLVRVIGKPLCLRSCCLSRIRWCIKRLHEGNQQS